MYSFLKSLKTQSISRAIKNCLRQGVKKKPFENESSSNLLSISTCLQL